MTTDPRLNGRRLLHDNRGTILALVAIALPVLLGFTALGVETGLWYTIKRYNQSAADIAALSGAMELEAGQQYPDICNLAKNAAIANGFTFQSFSCPTLSPGCTSPATGQMCVNNPPALGLHAGDLNYVEVILAQQQNTFFASLFLPSVTIDTRAVAGRQPFQTCMIALNQTGQDLNISGGGNQVANLSLTNCAFASDSTSPDSIRINGNAAMFAAAIQTSGGTRITSSTNVSVSPPVTTYASAVADPYAGQITVPPLSGFTNRWCPASSGGTFSPGYYTCGKNSAAMLFTSGTTILCPGVYVLDGEDNQGQAFGIHGTGTTVQVGTLQQCPGSTTDGVTIITTCTSSGSYGGSCGGGFDVGGTGSSDQPTVTLSAPTSSPGTGIPKDILFYQVASTADTKSGTSTLAGGPTVSLHGVIYTPATQITLSGNATSFGSCTVLIAGSFSLNGNVMMTAPACGISPPNGWTLALVE
jgi:hypothetical protein